MTEIPPVPTLLRVYGEADIEQASISGQSKHPLFVLTTNNYEHANDLDKIGVRIIHTDFDNEQAGLNSGAFLNRGFEHLLHQGYTYALLMASGYQTYHRELMNYLKHYFSTFPDQDVYFFITGSEQPVNEEDIFESNDPINIYEQREVLFPSESLAVVKIDSIYPLEEDMSRKGGELGYTNEGVPLGGIELLLTLLKRYKDSNKIWKPNMLGIFAPIIDRGAQFYSEIPSDQGLSPITREGFPTAVEFTSKEMKRGRRKETIDKALSVLGLTPEDYNDLFENTTVVNGESSWMDYQEEFMRIGY